MFVQPVALPSIGSMCVAVAALLFGSLQAGIALKRSEFAWCRWGAAVSASTLLYALAVFVQFNTPAGHLSLLAEKVQYTSFVLLIHAIFGFTFSYLSLPADRYHRLGLPLHAAMILVIWLSDLVIGTGFVERRFLLLSRAYVEPVLGPLGAPFLGYVSAAAIAALTYWIRNRRRIGTGAPLIIAGMSMWAVLGLHDAVVTLGVPSILFLMEYGFLGFSGAIVYATGWEYLNLYDVTEQTRRALAEAKTGLERRVQERTLDLVRSNEELQAEIVERKRIEEALKSSERFLEDVIESIQDGISVLDENLTIRHVNGVMNRWYADNLPLEGKKCYAAYHNAGSPCNPCPTLQSLKTGRPHREVVPGLEGSEVEWVELFTYPVKDRDTDQVTGVVEFVRDITEQARMEERLRQAERMDSLGRLAGGVAHDFNNLLMAIQGGTSLMLSDIEEGHRFTDHLNNIESTVKNAADLTRQLLGVARGGKYTVEATNINDLVEETLTLFWRTQKETSLEKDLQPDIWSVEVDRTQIRQVFLNLFVNAREAMSKGGILSVGTENVSLGRGGAAPLQLAPGNYVRASVADTGSGMDPEILKHIFDPFFTTKEMGRGTGLGLASAYGIIQNHNGCIEVRSEPGRGARFSIYLPASEKRARQSQMTGEKLMEGNETILLVDDEPVILEVGRKLLERLGYRVLTAESGEKAIQMVQNGADRVDLLILDMIMPGLGGGETFDALRSIDPAVRVLLSSGYSLDDEAAAILKRGCRGFIQKPFSLAALSTKIREVLDDEKPKAS